MRISNTGYVYLDEICRRVGGLKMFIKSRTGLLFLLKKLKESKKEEVEKDIFLLSSVLAENKNPNQNAICLLIAGRDIWSRQEQDILI